jgi:N-acetylglucosaminyl-diphospho-decaprenol L-rhamnosyltransferase
MTDCPVSVVVVTWNSASVIEGCLRTLATELPTGSEIVVVDNASGDNTVALVRQLCPDALVIVNAANRGLAAGNNQGMVAARGDCFLICNPDVEFQPDSVRNMLDVLARHERAAWIVPKQIHEDGVLQTSVGSLPTLSECLLGRQVARRRTTGTDSGFWWDGWPHDEERTVGHAFECAYVIRREAVDDIGLQDERYVLDWEGLDWSERFQRNGWEVWFAPDAVVMHLGGTARRQVPFRTVISAHRGMYYFYSDRRPAAWKPFLAAAFGARAVVKMALTRVGVPMYSWALRDRRTSPS